jgi:hypothetical protein
MPSVRQLYGLLVREFNSRFLREHNPNGEGGAVLQPLDRQVKGARLGERSHELGRLRESTLVDLSRNAPHHYGVLAPIVVEAVEAVASYIEEWEEDPEAPVPCEGCLDALAALRMHLSAVDAASCDDAHGDPVEEPAASQVGEQTSPVAQATALLLDADKTGRRWSVAQLAVAVGTARSSLYRDTQFNALVKALRSKKGAPPPRGQKDSEGNLDAWDE